MACKSKTLEIVVVTLLIWAFPALVGAVSPPIPDQPSQNVEDLAVVIEAHSRDRLNAMLKDLADNLKVPVVVLTVNSLEGEALDAFSLETALKWGKDLKLKRNGLLLTVAASEKKYLLEVGYDLQAILTAGRLNDICQRTLAPQLKKGGDLSSGIVAAVTEMTNHIITAKTSAARSSAGARSSAHSSYAEGYRAGGMGSRGSSARATSQGSGLVNRLQTISDEDAWPYAVAIFAVIGIIFLIGAYVLGLPIRFGPISFRRDRD